MCTPIDAIFRGRALDPDPGQAVDARRLDADGAECADQRLLEVAAVALHVLAVAGEVEDRVADELARPVVGRLAAAVGLDDLDLGAVGHVQLALVGAPAERDHRRVLEQENRVRDRALRDGGCERALQVPGLPVRNLAEVVDVRASRHSSSSDESACGFEVVRPDENLARAAHTAASVQAPGAEIRHPLHRIDSLEAEKRPNLLGFDLVRHDCEANEIHRR